MADAGTTVAKENLHGDWPSGGPVINRSGNHEVVDELLLKSFTRPTGAVDVCRRQICHVGQLHHVSMVTCLSSSLDLPFICPQNLERSDQAGIKYKIDTDFEKKLGSSL